MSGILQELIVGFITFLTTGGLGSILYFRLHKKLKESEVKASELENKSKEIKNVSDVNSEWEKITNKLLSEREELITVIHNQHENIKILTDKLDTLNLSKEKSWEMYSASKIECAKKDRLISELNWYRCEINGCPYRKPPRNYGYYDFPKDGVVNENDSKKNEN